MLYATEWFCESFHKAAAENDHRKDWCTRHAVLCPHLPLLFVGLSLPVLPPCTVGAMTTLRTHTHTHCKGKSLQPCTESTHLMLFDVKCGCQCQGDNQREYKVFIRDMLSLVSWTSGSLSPKSSDTLAAPVHLSCCKTLTPGHHELLTN